MENLNKENFWNEMYEKYPKTMKEFCGWVDEYKKKINWDGLFNAGLMTPIRGHSISSKFHDLPLALQMGIWYEYLGAYKLDDCKREVESHLYSIEQCFIKTPPLLRDDNFSGHDDADRPFGVHP